MRSAIERGDPAEIISTRMAADLQTTLSRQLYGGDITGSVSLSTDVLALARSQYGLLPDRNERQTRATNFTESFGSSGDHLLSEKAVPTLHLYTNILLGQLGAWHKPPIEKTFNKSNQFLEASSNAATPATSQVLSQGAFFHPGVRTSQPSLDRSRLRLGYYVFTTVGKLLGEGTGVIVNSHVIGASVDDATRSLQLPQDEPATFTFYHLQKNGLYLMLIQVFESDKTRLFLYYKFSYGFPAAIVAVSAGVTWHNYGTDEYCWIDTSSSTLWAFIGPIIGVILANVVFLGIALKVVLSVRSRDRSDRDRILGWLKGSATLLCLLGITWVFGFLTAVKGTGGVVFSWIFTILNCAQGVFIFVLHVLMNSKANYNSGSSPNTGSTDDKEKQLTPTTKTSEWLRHLPMESERSPASSPRSSDDITHEDRRSASSDPRGSQLDGHGDPVEKHAPVKRKKFPLGASENERRSKDVVVVRF
ncbi:hypothetical protein GCK32_011216 [Trichostrongylus colubriformis]|uniref:G-protein coupled receptors family 2 profile 2 domain-containing protein n=1 Tax=Trichostrongylus colubriformis TaxID=6319 RepID=A0AAN8IHE9_TRICO